MYGEVKDPFKNYVNTVEKLSTLKAEQDFLYDVADDLVSRGLARKASRGDRLPDSFFNVEQIAQERLNKIFGQNLAGKKKMLVVDPEDKEVIRLRTEAGVNLTSHETLSSVSKFKIW